MNGLVLSTRQLLRAPGFLTLATLALALGIGSTTTIFSIVRAVFLRALPYSEPETLMQLTSSVKSSRSTARVSPTRAMRPCATGRPRSARCHTP